jgi:ADP-heptose:LPS heptosyltransferase
MNILVIRLGLLGDMVCTTPMLEAIKKRFPDGRLCLLSNEYNRAVVARNPYIDRVYTYIHTKGRQRNPRTGFFASLIDAWRLKRDLKREHFDWIVVCNGGFNKPSVRMAQNLGGKIISATREDGSYEYRVDFPISGLLEPLEHEIVRTFRLLAPLGIEMETLPQHLTLSADAERVAHYQKTYPRLPDKPFRLGVHISASEPARQWPIPAFAQLINTLSLAHPSVEILVFYGHGQQGQREALTAALHVPVTFMPPGDIDDLMAGLSLCDMLVCNDGGVLHLAAGLGVPIVGLFEGNPMKIGCWYPWGVAYTCIAAPDGNPVAGIQPPEVVDAVSQLLSRQASKPL